MTKATLNISEDLKLPAEDALESAIGILGKRGRGKTGLVKVLMEEMVRVKLPFIAFDPVGVMWGIRSSLDGTGPGLPVLIVGGSHGDIPLDKKAGSEVANAIVQANVSTIIDFSEVSKTIYRQFVRDFSRTLFSINDIPRMVIIEEASELVPQRLRPDLAETFESVERLVSRGRNKGIGVTMVSQRPATINKDVLTQVDSLFVFGLTSPQDRKALREWVEAKDDEGRIKEFEDGIAGLQKREAWFWSPEAFGGAFKKIKIRLFKTFHPDKTHLRRKGLLKNKPVTTDVPSIIKKLGTQMERLSKEKTELASAPVLKSQIRKLEKELEKAKAKPVPTPHELLKARSGGLEEARRQTTTIIQDAKKQCKEIEEVYQKHITTLTSGIKQRDALLGNITALTEKALPPIDLNFKKPQRVLIGGTKSSGMAHAPPSPPQPTPKITPKPTTPDTVAPRPEIQPFNNESDKKLGRCSRKVYAVMYANPDRVFSKTQLALLSEYRHTSGGFATALSDLRTRGLIKGTGVVGFSLDAPDSSIIEGVECGVLSLDYWKDNLPRCSREIFSFLLKNPSTQYARDTIAENTFTPEGEPYQSTSGGFATALSKLRTLGLIVRIVPGVFQFNTELEEFM